MNDIGETSGYRKTGKGNVQGEHVRAKMSYTPFDMAVSCTAGFAIAKVYYLWHRGRGRAEEPYS